VTDAIWAAIITGGAQLIAGAFAILAAWIALSSWRRNALGSRQIQLAEECLQSLWRLDDQIKSARLLLMPHTLDEARRFREAYEQSRADAIQAIANCRESANDFKEKVKLAEVYLGAFPRTRLPDTSRRLGISYSVYEDFIEVVENLSSALRWKLSLKYVRDGELSLEAQEEFGRSANLYSGFFYEYEEDDYSFRLRISRISSEQHLSSILRRRSRYERSLGINRLEMRLAKKYKPVMVNKFAVKFR